MSQTSAMLSVSELNAQVSASLASEFATVWVQGEISNLAQPQSGHMYFTLKDHGAQVRCALFRNARRFLNTMPAEGQAVQVQARVSLYEPRGDYQLIVSRLEAQGDGVLRQAFEQLKQKLQKAGLFEQENKQALPEHPHRIGVITSPTGAAIRDILAVLRRRHAQTPVIIYPTRVQGKGASQNIISALQRAQARQECDVLLLARGGGSLEDLHCFNDEALALAIAHCPIPTVSGIGHEVDFTIADFVVDVRAPTPSAAAELVSPHWHDYIKGLLRARQRLIRCWQSLLIARQQMLHYLVKRLRHPRQQLENFNQQLDYTWQRLHQAMEQQLQEKSYKIQKLRNHMLRYQPQSAIEKLNQQLEHLTQRLRRSMLLLLAQQSQELQQLSRLLHELSPLATLSRGYSVLQHSANQAVICSAQQVRPGDKLLARLHQGELSCTVESIKKSNS